MIALPSFINSRIRRGDFQRRVHRGVRRDRFDSGAVAQRKLWDGERIEERISARVRRADLPAWRDFLRETNGGAGWFDYQVPGTNPVRTVRARIIGGDIRERVLDGAGENTLLQMRLEWRNIKRAWQPSDAIADKFLRWIGIWGHPTYINGDPAVNQIIGGEAAVDADGYSVGDDGKLNRASGSYRVSIPAIKNGETLLLFGFYNGGRQNEAMLDLGGGNYFSYNSEISINRRDYGFNSSIPNNYAVALSLADDGASVHIHKWSSRYYRDFNNVTGGWHTLVTNGSDSLQVTSASFPSFAACVLSSPLARFEISNQLQIASTSQSVFGLAEWSDS